MAETVRQYYDESSGAPYSGGDARSVHSSASTTDHSGSNDDADTDGSSSSAAECPLCLEPFDETDKQFHPCTCGYQICLWCWHSIMESGNQRCPACRSKYEQHDTIGQTRSLSVYDAGQLLEAKALKKREQQQQQAAAATTTDKPSRVKSTSVTSTTSAPSSSSNDDLTDIRVIQRNLVYCIGIPASIARSDILSKREYFGRYGKILKIAVARQGSSKAASTDGKGNTYAAYITYKSNDAASEAIKHMDNSTLNGVANPPIRCTHGTTKYCSTWLNGRQCTSVTCLYLHSRAKPEDITTKEQLALMWQDKASHSSTSSYDPTTTPSSIQSQPSPTNAPAQTDLTQHNAATPIASPHARKPSYAAVSLQHSDSYLSNDSLTPRSQPSPSQRHTRTTSDTTRINTLNAIATPTSAAPSQSPTSQQQFATQSKTTTHPTTDTQQNSAAISAAIAAYAENYQLNSKGLIITADESAEQHGIEKRPSLSGTPSVRLHLTTNYASRLRLQSNHLPFNFSLFQPSILPAPSSDNETSPFDASLLFTTAMPSDEQQWISIIQ